MSELKIINELPIINNQKKQTRIYIETYGCTANVADSEIMSGLLIKNGFAIAKTKDEADLNIINTCAVKTPTEHRMVHKIKQFDSHSKPLIVAGCLAQAQSDIVIKNSDKASLIGPNAIHDIVKVTKKTLNNQRSIHLENNRKTKSWLPRIRQNPIVNIIEVANGCGLHCSYCITKNARGKLMSYPQELILSEMRASADLGCLEYWITSQDNACYGIDINSSLPNLMNGITSIDNDFKVRIGMMSPLYVKRIVDELVQCYQNNKFFKFLHLPIQSGSSRILNLMRRGHDEKLPLEIIKKFRSVLPEITVSTDIIIGFPTETELDFMETISVIEKMDPDIVNISKFGIRPGTRAKDMDQIPRKIINERSKRFSEIVKTISLNKNKKWIGWKGNCLIDEVGKKPNTWMGRNSSYKPIVIKTDRGILGKKLQVEIIDVTYSYLIGKIIE